MKIKVNLHANMDRFADGDIAYHVSNLDMSEYWGQIVCTQEVEFDIHDLKPTDLIPDAIARLRKEQSEIRAEAERKSAQIEERISKMLALEFTP